MSLQRVAAVISAVVLAGWAVTASAGGEYGRSGPYVGAGGVYAIENIDAPAGISSVDDSWGYNIKGGYRFNQIFALEAKWEQWLGFDYSPAFDFDGWLVSASGKAFFSDGPIQPFVLAGLGMMGGQDSSPNPGKRDVHELGVRFGAGMDFYASRNWAVSAEAGYVLGTGDLSGYDLIPISLGVMYRFY